MDEKNLQDFVVELDEARRDLAYEGTVRVIDMFDEQKEARSTFLQACCSNKCCTSKLALGTPFSCTLLHTVYHESSWLIEHFIWLE